MNALTAHRDTDKIVLRLAWPCVMENIASTMISLVDTAMIGSLGPAASAAVGSNGPPSWLLSGLIQAVGIGGTALVARLIGAGERKEAGRVTFQVFRVALLMSAFLSIAMIFLAPCVPIIMRTDPSLHADAGLYMRILAFSFIPSYTGIVLGSLLRGAGDVKTPMIAGLLSNVTNVTLNFFLIYAPRRVSVLGLDITVWGAGLGVAGAAAASAVAMSAAGIFIFLRMRRENSVLRLTFARKTPWDMSIVRRVLRIALPAGGERMAVNVGQMVFAGMVAAVGVVELAAHSQAIQIEALGYMPAFGFAAAATTLVGQGLGAGDFKRAREQGARALTLCTVMLTFIGVLMFIFAPFLISLFTPDPATRLVGAALIRICAFEQPFNAVCNVVSGALRGAGDTAVPFWISLVSMWGVRILGAVILTACFGLGVYAIWWAMVADLGLRSLLLLIRFFKGKWTLSRV